MAASFGEGIDKQGWQAGTVAPASMLPALNAYLTRNGRPRVDVQQHDWLVLITQTCDVVSAKEENEPHVEFLLCRPIAALRDDFRGRRSTRRLDFKPNKETHGDVHLTAHATDDRFVVPRSLLCEHAPDQSRRLSERSISNIQQWYALRYARPVWPDAFHRRIGRQSFKKLVAALKDIPTDDVEVRVSINPRDKELADGEPYSISVYFVIDKIVWDTNHHVRQLAFASFAKFISALNGCSGLVVNEEFSGVKNGEEFSWQLTRSTDEWNFANLSESEWD